MKAIRIVDKNKVRLVEIEKPRLRMGTALVKMNAVGLNRRDYWISIGKYPNITYPCTMGSDGSGIVESVSDESQSHWLGKEVVLNPNVNWGNNEDAAQKDYHILGMPGNGTFAEYICIDTQKLHEKPSHLSHIQAAALPLGGVTAFRTLFVKARALQHQKVLITGAGGGVAQLIQQFAVCLGCKVYVTTSSDEKIKLSIKNGAIAGFNYKHDDWMRIALSTAGQFDAVIDGSGGSYINEYIRLVKAGGRIVIYGSTAGMPQNLDIYRLFWNQIQLIGSTMGSDMDFSNMIQFVKDKSLKPSIDEVFKIEEWQKAFEKMEKSSQFGKIILTF